MIGSVADLEELLSRPSESDIAASNEWRDGLMILGAGGKMGPTLAMRAKRALKEAGHSGRVLAVARFTDLEARGRMEAAGVECVACDLLDRAQVAALPDCGHIIHAAGRKFGSSGDPSLTWAMNVLVPSFVCERFAGSRIVAFSSGNVYPFAPVVYGGCSEASTPAPVGEYAWTGLGRERVFEYHSRAQSLPVVLLRLNYAVELRYGVLLDIGSRVFERQPIDLSMGAVNVIWQGDANSVALRAFPIASSPAAVLNLTGPETLGVRRIAEAFGSHFGVTPQFTGEESADALLNNAGRCHRLFGYPSVSPDEVIEWTARWIGMGGATLGKPTHFETRDGRF